VRRSQSAYKGRDSGPVSDIFVAVAYIGAGVAAVLVLVAAMDRPAAAPAAFERPADPSPQIRKELDDRGALSLAWQQTLTGICENLDLQAEGLAPNCRTGAITLGDRLFEEPTSPQLS
jgi:hypothetical protein